MKPDRVIIGTTSDKAIKIMNDSMRRSFCQGNPIIFMDEHSAELTKYAANSFLAKISFMNEVARLCELMGADVDMVRRGIGSDDRIGKRSCFRYRLWRQLFSQRRSGPRSFIQYGRV